MKGGGSFTNPPKRITVPSGGESSGNPYIIIAGDTTQSGTSFASVIFRTPTLPVDWEYRLQIREAPPPFEAQFELVLWDTSTDDQVSRLITQNWNSVADTLSTVVGPRYDDPQHGQSTYVWGHDSVEVMSQDNAGAGQLFLASNTIFLDGQTLPSASDLETLQIGQFNASLTPEIVLKNKTLGFNVANINMLVPPAPAGLAVAGPITITGASTTTFVKQYADTQVEMHMSAGGYITAGAGAIVTFGVLFSGGVGDFSITRGSFSSLSNRLQFSGSRIVTGIPAGSYTVTPRWGRSGASTVIMDASDASLTVTVKEVKEA